MASMVTRTVTTTTITAVELKIENGTPVAVPVEPLTISGKVKNEDFARKLLNKTYGSKAYAQIAFDAKNELYGVPVDVFMQHAQPVARKTKKEA